MSLEIDADFSLQLGKRMDGIESRIKATRRFRFFSRRLYAQVVPTAAGLFTADMGSPSSGTMWTVAFCYHGPLGVAPWNAISQANWNGGALCIGTADNFSETDVILPFSNSTVTVNSINPEPFGFPTDAIWVYPGESVYVAESFINTSSSTFTVAIVREYNQDDILPSYI